MMTRVGLPPTIDLAKVGTGRVWHIVERTNDGRPRDLDVVAVCGVKGPSSGIVSLIDARVVRHQGATVCENCRSIHTYHANNPGASPEKEDVTMATTTTAPRTSSSSSRTAKAVTKQELEKAIKRADRAIATQPKRTTADLTKRQAEKAFVLGKGISADRWRLSLAVPGKSSSATIAAMVERIEARVAERNALRK